MQRKIIQLSLMHKDLPSNGGWSIAMSVRWCRRPCSRRIITSVDTSHHPLALEFCWVFQVPSKSGSVDAVSDDVSGGSDMNGESNAIRSTRDASRYY